MFVLRHGQSEFNAVFTATRRDPGIEDPSLTALGARQAEAAACALAAAGVTRILSSPYTRALQTAAAIARRTGGAIEVSGVVREHFKFVCDVGSPRSRLAAAWPACDFSALEERWWPETDETRESVAGRAQALRDTMVARADAGTTVVVCHWGFGLALTGRTLDNGEWVEIDPSAPAPNLAATTVFPT